MKEKLDGVFCTRLKLSREFLDAELKSRDLEWKIHRKEKCLSRMEIVCDNNTKVIDVYQYIGLQIWLFFSRSTKY